MLALAQLLLALGYLDPPMFPLRQVRFFPTLLHNREGVRSGLPFQEVWEGAA